VYALPGRGYVDDARYAVPSDNAPKYTILAMGANHNYFNRNWTPDQFPQGSVDDWTIRDKAQTDPHCGTNAAGNARLTSAKQRGVGVAYLAAFFRKNLLFASAFDGILKGDSPPPPSAQTTAIYTGYVPGAADRRDLNRLATTTALSTNTMGGAAIAGGLSNYSLCGNGIGPTCNISRDLDTPYDGLSAVKLWWESQGPSYRNLLLADSRRDVSNFGALQFRVALDYSNAQNPAGADQDFTVRLTDGWGRVSSLAASAYEKIYFPPGTSDHRTAVANTARLPIAAFTGIDVTNVAAVTFIFDRAPRGGIAVSDVAFADDGISIAERVLVANGP